jgi:CheY-like chemotaxis protein
MDSDLSAISRLRILVVDDDPGWREELLSSVLRRLEEFAGQSTRVDTADDEIQGREKLASADYDLAVVDLSLLGKPPDGKDPDDRGFELLRKIRTDPSQRRCGVLVVTGVPTGDRMHRALREFGATRVVVKPEYEDRDDPEEFLLDLAKAAILEGRVRGTAERRRSRAYLTMTFNGTGWIDSELRSPAGKVPDRIESAKFDIDDYVRRADNINLLLVNDKANVGWRKEMASLGESLFKTVAAVPKLYDKWSGSKPLVKERGDLWLRFRSPSEGLGVPVDLMREGTEYFCRRHVLSRELIRTGFTRALAPFSEFISELASQNLPLRILLVGANGDGKIPAVDEEVRQLSLAITADLRRIGLRCDPTVLTGDAASYGRVKKELQKGRHHVFHYAGHGRYDGDHPEASGLLLRHEGGTRALTAGDLSQVVSSDLQLVYLSCCLGAVNKSQPASDEFCGIYGALAQANVPTVMGYRWVVRDAAALLFAATFYAHLWRTLCPGEAVLEARREAAMGEWGLDDHTWAAPVLLMQSP